MAREKSGKDRITKADRTRARLIEVATRLFQEHGSDEVTVRRIAAAAKIEAGSIYSAGGVLYTVSHTHINAYIVWEELEAKLLDRLKGEILGRLKINPYGKGTGDRGQGTG